MPLTTPCSSCARTCQALAGNFAFRLKIETCADAADQLVVSRENGDAAAGRKPDVAIQVMVTAKEQAEIRKAANKAAMPMSVYVRARALAAARAG